MQYLIGFFLRSYTKISEENQQSTFKVNENVCMLANNFTKRKNKYMGFIWWISCREFEGEVINGITCAKMQQIY